MDAAYALPASAYYTLAPLFLGVQACYSKKICYRGGKWKSARAIKNTVYGTRAHILCASLGSMATKSWAKLRLASSFVGFRVGTVKQNTTLQD